MRSVDTSNTRVNSMAEIKLEDLRKWFGKGKKGDWVRVGTDGEIKGQCAREPGEGKPKCMPRSKAHSMDKKDRASSARRKRRADPMADRPGTGNKPIMVKTDKKESVEMQEKTKWKMGDGRPRNGARIQNDRFWNLPKASLEYIRKDAHDAMKANPNGKKAGKYADEVNDAETVLAWRKKNGIKESVNEASATNVNKIRAAYKDFMKKKGKNFDDIAMSLTMIANRMTQLARPDSSGRGDYKAEKIIKDEASRIQGIVNKTYNTEEGKEIRALLIKHKIYGNGSPGSAIQRLTWESVNEASKVPAGMKFIASYVYKDANGNKHTHRHLRKGTKMTDPVVVYIDDKEWKTFQSFTKAKQAAINHIKGMKESVDMNEETAIAHQTPYGTVTAYKRDTKGMRGKQDGFKLTLKTKSGKTVDLGSHPKPTKANVMSIVKNVMQKESVELDEEDNKFFFVRVGKPGDTMTVKYKAKNSREALKKAKSRHFGNPVTLDPNQKQGRPVGPLESVDLEEKNVPTNPALWAKFKAQAKAKFDVYPSAYANGWAAKKYKAAGGSWKKESVEMPEQKTFWDVREGSCGTMNAQTKNDLPFEPTRKVGVKKDRFGNVVKDKNRARHLSKLAMRDAEKRKK